MRHGHRKRDKKNKGRGRREHRTDGRKGGATTLLKGVVDKNRKGFAFLQFDRDDVEDSFVPAREAAALFHGDRIEAEVTPSGEVVQLKVLEHRFQEMFGRYEPAPHRPGSPRGGWIIFERKRAREEVFIPGGVSGAQQGDWLRAKLQFHESGLHAVTAEVLECFGPDLPATADVSLIASEFALIDEHPRAAEEQAAAIKFDPGHRTDLRHIPFITIDGETARDFDDAVYVEHAKSGHVLWVGIADVSHYVQERSAIDTDARSRGTSVYFPERAFHMLPRALSENLCSLRPNEPRLALVAELHYDFHLKRTKTVLHEALIQSRRRATYTEIQAEWAVNKKNKQWEYAPHFELYFRLRERRTKRGSIDFDLPEPEVLVNEKCEPIKILNRERWDSHRLIEEFMIAANEAVTEWMMERAWPFIYRVHDEPSAESLEKFRRMAKTVGLPVAFSGENLHETIVDLLRRAEGHAAEPLLNIALLRSMKQAIYSATYGKHFGLASKAYTHFTSPIRRYPDLVVHRLLRMALRAENGTGPAPSKVAFKRMQKDLEDIAEHCSYRERLADEADREAIRLKQARYMKRHLGDEFTGKVNGLVESGIFVQLAEPYVEGMVPREALSDDYYEFHEDRMAFIGRRTKRTFRIGDPISVKVVRADLDTRRIDFALAAVRAC